MVALIVTLACLPLLVIDAVGASSSSRPASTVAAPAPEPSLVVANSPSTESTTTSAPSSTTTTTEVPSTTTAPPAPTTTVAPAPSVPVWVPPTTLAPPVTVRIQTDAEFLACVRERESHGDYTAIDSSGLYMGAYQIYQGGWDDMAARIGRTDLIGVAPNVAAPADQDRIAAKMLEVHGREPWGGLCG